MRPPQVQTKSPPAVSPVKLSPDITAMLRALAWFKGDTVAELTRPHLLGPVTAEFGALPEFARQKWIGENPARQPTPAA